MASRVRPPRPILTQGRYGAIPWAMEVAIQRPEFRVPATIAQSTVDCERTQMQQPMTNAVRSHSFARSPPFARRFVIGPRIRKLG